MMFHVIGSTFFITLPLLVHEEDKKEELVLIEAGTAKSEDSK